MQFPIGIDPERFIQALETDQVKLHIKELRRFFAGRKVRLGVDRLDMIKGIPQKLLAFEMFLEKHPEWQENVLLVQIAVPTRTDVPEYQRLTSQVHEIVGRINGRFGSVTFVPIHHLDRSLAFHELCALYASTGTFALSDSMMPSLRFTNSSCSACHASLCCPVVVEMYRWWWGWGFLLGSRCGIGDITTRRNEPCEL
jgi:trehalose 6-phosphate synthase/phosphatase